MSAPLDDEPSASPSAIDAVSIDALVALPAGSVGALADEVVAVDDELAVLPAGALAPRAAELLDAWLARPDLTCCACVAALEVTLDGRSWTELPFDHFWHQAGWVHLALDAVTRGRSSTFVWDESSLFARRDGDRLVLWDRRWEVFRRPFAWHPVSVPLRPFVEALVAACSGLDALCRAVALECARRGVDADRADALLAGLGDRPRPAADDLPRRLAVVAREMGRGELSGLAPLRELAARL